MPGEIADLVSGRIGGRLAANERNALVFSGIGYGLADAAPAAVVYEKAVGSKGTRNNSATLATGTEQ